MSIEVMPEIRLNYYLYYGEKRLKLERKKIYTIGRNPECDIVLNHKSVSRIHCRLEWEGGTFWIRDLKSTNGLFVNSKPVTRQMLGDGDQIRAGVYYLEYRTMAPREKETPSDTMKIEKQVEELIKEIDDPEISNRLLTIKHYMNRQTEKLASLAYNDTLTGLFNRRHFDNKLEEELIRAERYKRPLSLIMIDIDHFKKFNDTHGHQKGDEVLEVIAGFIKANIRSSDIPCRYGGEEMAIILPETENAYPIGEKIRKYIKTRSRQILGLEVTVSLGISSMAPAKTTPETLIAAADKALYRAKEKGRDRVEQD